MTKFEYEFLKYNYDGEGEPTYTQTIEVADEIIQPIIDYLAEIGHEDKLRMVILNGCRSVETTMEFMDDFINGRFDD